MRRRFGGVVWERAGEDGSGDDWRTLDGRFSIRCDEAWTFCDDDVPLDSEGRCLAHGEYGGHEYPYPTRYVWDNDRDEYAVAPEDARLREGGVSAVAAAFAASHPT